MTDDNESQEHKTVDGNTKEKQPRKKREVTAYERLKDIEKDEAELEKKLQEIKEEKKVQEIEYYRELYSLIGKAVWEDLEDTKNIDETEYHKQLNQLKRILKSKIKTKENIKFLKFKNLIEH